MAGVKPLGVHHVSINVDDLAAALSFYTTVLGLEGRTDRPDFGIGGAWLNAGTQQVHLIDAPVPPNQGQHFALAFGDLVAVVEELRRQGITVSDPVTVGRGMQCFTTDPSGNTVELHQPATA